MILGKPLADQCAQYPLLDELIALRETCWLNPAVAPAAEAFADVRLSAADVAEASACLDRFAPYLARMFVQLLPAPASSSRTSCLYRICRP